MHPYFLDCRFTAARINKLEYGNDATFPISQCPRMHVEGSCWALDLYNFPALLPELMPCIIYHSVDGTLRGLVLTNQTTSWKVNSRIQAFPCQLPRGETGVIVLNLVYDDEFVIVDSEGIFWMCFDTHVSKSTPFPDYCITYSLNINDTGHFA